MLILLMTFELLNYNVSNAFNLDKAKILSSGERFNQMLSIWTRL